MTAARYLEGTTQDETNGSCLEMFAKSSLLWKQAHLVHEGTGQDWYSIICPTLRIYFQEQILSKLLETESAKYLDS